jgi:N-acetylglucosamine-6-sulfatase
VVALSRIQEWVAVRLKRSRGVIAASVTACACLLAAGCGGGENPARFGITLLPPSVHATSARLAAGPHRPNIVFVLTDDLSLDLLRFMPHVLAMERHGLTFRDYFVSDSLCCPSRASIFTGNFPHDTHVLSNAGRQGGFRAFHARGEELHTFAIALQRVGYLTAMMGKYLNGYLESPTSLHEARSAADVPSAYVSPGWNEWSAAGWGYPEFDYQLNQGGTLYHFGHRPEDYMTNVLARKGVQFIHAAAQRHQPFFLELATFAPHKPYVPAPRDAHDFPRLKAPRPPNFNVLPTFPPRWLGSRPPLTGQQLREIDRVFRRRAQSVQAVDRMIGRIQQALAATGQARNTYIVFSSDNGLHTGEYRLMPGKLTAFNTDIHVPLIVTGPGVKPGTSTKAVAENIDLAKTFAAIGGARMFGDGHSLLGLWQGRTPVDWRNVALIEHYAPPLTNRDPDFQQPASGQPNTYAAMRTRNYLFVEYSDGEIEFYDLRRDPYELNNIAGQLSFQQLARLFLELQALKHCHEGHSCWAAMHIPPLPGRW